MSSYPLVSATNFSNDPSSSVDGNAFSSSLISNRNTGGIFREMFAAEENLSTNSALFYNSVHGPSIDVSNFRFNGSSVQTAHSSRYEMTAGDCLFDPNWIPSAADALMYPNFPYHSSLSQPTNHIPPLFDSVSVKTLLPPYTTSGVSLSYTNSTSSNKSLLANSMTTASMTSIASNAKMFKCVTCGKEYCRKSTLKAHLKQHMGDRPFSCQVCGKTFSQATNLTAHKRVHTGEKPFSCSICLRPFSQSSSLVTHKRTHTGERPYPCQMCDKAFTDSSTLTKHLRTHTGHKPYGCNLCMMRFSQSGNLHRHMKTHRVTQRP